ncbi:uncharacterized protein IUM83_04648 [Phytophthora cinnamomi]|uniref:uncharacterized protein n=1 Tax=Phytophthora cinnamomi TaxID=4785 RepID=UPI0035595B19|nr:hypothetical protein IUM83_04648 [Phytophthora cinnamomi]
MGRQQRTLNFSTTADSATPRRVPALQRRAAGALSAGSRFARHWPRARGRVADADKWLVTARGQLRVCTSAQRTTAAGVQHESPADPRSWFRTCRRAFEERVRWPTYARAVGCPTSAGPQLVRTSSASSGSGSSASGAETEQYDSSVRVHQGRSARSSSGAALNGASANASQVRRKNRHRGPVTARLVQAVFRPRSRDGARYGGAYARLADRSYLSTSGELGKVPKACGVPGQISLSEEEQCRHAVDVAALKCSEVQQIGI